MSVRRGAVVVLTAVVLVVLLLLIAFAVDLGYLCTVRTELQSAADAGALAGAAELPAGVDKAKKAAQTFVEENVDAGSVKSRAGRWDASKRVFVANQPPRDAFEVTVYQPETPLFFGRLIGRDSQSMAGSAVATYQPRDIVLVLDFSGSMNTMSRVNELKNSVKTFVTVLKDIAAPDRVAFIRYSTTGESVVSLTGDFPNVQKTIDADIADGWTNIGEGMQLGRIELTKNSRPTAAKMIVLMTDGKVNRPLDRDCRAYVIEEANLAKKGKIGMITVSFGDDADQGLMQEVADITGGVHFNVPDDASSGEDLRAVFRKIALKRAPVLVK